MRTCKCQWPALMLVALLAMSTQPPCLAQPSRRWQVPVPGQAVDVLDLVAGRGILVGGVDPDHPALANHAVPRYRDLALHDADSGALRWRFDRGQLGADWIDLIAHDPIVLGYIGSSRRRSGYLVLDAATGRELWRSTDYEWLRPSPDGRLGVALDQGMFSTELVGVSLTEGTKRWTRPAPKELTPGAVEFVGDALVLLGNDIARLDPVNGKTLWSAAFPGDRPQALRLVTAGDALLALDAHWLQSIDVRDGSRRWLWQAPRALLTSLAAIGDTLVVYQRFADGQGLVALRAGDGQPIWDARESRRLTSPPLAFDAKLCYTTDIFLVCRDSASGRETLRTPLPYSMVLGDAAPRRLARAGERIVVACEVAVAAWDVPSGTWDFHQPYDGKTHLPLSIAAYPSASPPASASVGRSSPPWPPTEVRTAPAMRPNDFHVWQAQRNLDFARARVGTANASQRRQAQGEASLAAQQLGIAQSMQRAAERNEAIRGFGESVLGAFDALRAAVQQANAAGRAWDEADGLRASDAMFQGRWHLRQLRWGELQVIDLKAGSVARVDFDFPLGSSLRSRVRSFVLNDDGKTLLTTALHELRTERRPIGEGKDARGGKFSLFQHYLTAIDLEQLPFKRMPEAREGKARSSWEWMVAGNLNELRKSLSYGGKLDVESAMFTVHATTPLMVAAFIGRTDVAQWLLDQGADPRKIDRAGWTALDYAQAAGQAPMVELLRGKLN